MAATALSTATTSRRTLPPSPASVRTAQGAYEFVSRNASAIAWGLVGVGIALRLSRYLLRFPLWGDELFLAHNFLDRDYRTILEPLDFGQVAPPLYLYLELAITSLLGFSEWSLRGVALLSGIGGLVLFRVAAGRVISGLPLVFAVAALAVAYYPMRHSAEVKPYGSDLFVSAALLALTVAWCRRPDRTRYLWTLAAAAPVAIFLSYPAVLILAGTVAALTPAAWKSRQPRGLAALGSIVGTSLVGFVALQATVAGTQSAATHDDMQAYWDDAFPPLDNPWAVPLWIADKLTGEMFAVPAGADRGGSILTSICAAIGVWWLWHRGDRTLALLLPATICVGIGAATLHRYPFGAARLGQYLVPLVALMAGIGAASAIERLRSVRWRDLAVVTVVGLVLVGAGLQIVRDMTHPYKHRVDYEHRAFAIWFWGGVPEAGQTICLWTDLGLQFYPETEGEAYCCYKRIYAPAATDALAAPWLSGEPPQQIRCVVYHGRKSARDEAAFTRWKQELESRYKLAGRESYRVELNEPPNPSRIGVYDVYSFRLRAAERPATTAQKTESDTRPARSKR